MTTPYLSVVMPCLNAASTIGRSVASVRGQCRDDVELVLADGGSTDGTRAAAGDGADLSWVSEPDHGLSDAFNKGAARARGEVLGWLNADDVYLPGALDAVCAAFQQDPELVWLTGQCLIVDGQGVEIRKGVTRYKNALLRRYSFRLHLTHNFVSAPATFFRRSAFEELGGLDLSLRYSMDYDLYLQLGKAAQPRILGQPLAAFTMAAGTLSMTGFEQQFVEHHEVARRHAHGVRGAATANRLLSRGILWTYRGMARRRSSASVG